MTELMKRYEAETGLPEGSGIDEIRKWFEGLPKTYRSVYPWGYTVVQQLLSENAKLKAQLTWRPVSEKPEKDGDYLCRWEGTGRFVALYKNKAWFIWDDELEEHVELVHLPYMWLPIPPAPEGKV